jgi:hypothetical protein
MRRHVIEQLGGFRLAESPSSDYGLIARAHVAGCRWKGVARPFVVYALGGMSDVQVRKSRLMAWAISRAVFGTTASRQVRWAYRFSRDLIKAGLREAGLGGIVQWYQRRLARTRAAKAEGKGGE